MRQVIVHCTGCWETFEAAPELVGALCGQGQVRLASTDEAAAYCDGLAGCYCDSPSWAHVACEVH